ncbi:SpoIIE family protein phosphatase [Streptomyces angustmyceticus]|uniref:SpoIIE family protein phosphatase n=1 Tax=Streptomyces angustmyceticus TaxID=285578 RepID=UPI0021B07F31|nr:SpoIIE family protein phosphatase [Streptomyces angustmyceticus]
MEEPGRLTLAVRTVGPAGRPPSDPAVWLSAVHGATSKAARSRTARELLAGALDAAAPLMGDLGGALLLLDASGRYLFLVASQGLPADVALPMEAIGIDEELSVTDAVRKACPVWLNSFDQRQTRYPGLVDRLPVDLVTGALPLIDNDTVIGVLTVLRQHETGFSPVERSFLRCLADHAGPALAALTGRQLDHGGPEDEDVAADASGTMELGTFVWHLDTGVVEGDDALARLHGLAPRSDPPLTLEEFLAQVPATDLPALRQSLGHIAQRCADYQVRYRAYDATGRLRTLEARGRAHPAADGHPMKMDGLVADITVACDRQQLNQRLLSAQAEQSGRLRDLASQLVSAAGLDDVANATGTALRAFGADGLLVVDTERDRLRVIASWGYGPAEESATEGFPLHAPTPFRDALLQGTPTFAGSLREGLAGYPSLVDFAHATKRQSWAVLPLPTAQDGRAACLIGFSAPHEFAPAERSLLTVVAALLAQAMDRARIHDREHRRAVELQQGMLPRALPELRNTTVHTHYRPAAEGAAVGGDWYDAWYTPSGELALVVGDVQGHSTAAAAVMGRLRTAVRAYSAEGHSPADVLNRTNALLTQSFTDPDYDLFATCVIAHLDTATGRLSLCRAGHPQPLHAGPGKQPAVLAVDGGLPLGIEPDAVYPTTTVTLAPGSHLLLYTDGLVERPGLDLDTGTRQLLTVFGSGLRTVPESALLPHIEQVCLPAPVPGDADDIAALYLRWQGPCP